MAGAKSGESVRVFGVRHHGPGSARALVGALQAMAPSAVLIEGPPDANDLIALAGDDAMVPPIALLVHQSENPAKAVFYPFAEFSPEWCAIRYAHASGVPAAFIDLPQAHRLSATEPDAGGEANDPDTHANEPRTPRDPLDIMARAAGHDDSESWWDHVVESRRDSADAFAAISELMHEARSSIGGEAPDAFNNLREAHMRRSMREWLARGHDRLAVVCGAWHAPALEPACWPTAKADADLLKGLAKVKVACTWIPWTHGRLTRSGGYGAGIRSPGWYEHLWLYGSDVCDRWLTSAARLLRAEGLEASSGSVIEAARLVRALAALRSSPRPGLGELSEAIRAVFTAGETAPLELIERKLIVGERLGRVPESAPMVPLQRDLSKLQKSLRLAPSAAQTIKALDLREATDRARSVLLHRLLLLEIAWGEIADLSGKGTFKEAWTLEWRPEFSVDVIEASIWGSTVEEAAAAKARDACLSAKTLAKLCDLIERILLADLPPALQSALESLAARSAAECDAAELLDSLGPLVNVTRYGDVRKTDVSMIAGVLDGIVDRATIGLVGACSALDDSAAEAMFASVNKANSALRLLGEADKLERWNGAILDLARTRSAHAKLRGGAVRIALDGEAMERDLAERLLSAEVSTGSEPVHAAAWLEGFLHRGGALLCHDDSFFGFIDRWLAGLSETTFESTLPLLRRTFSDFESSIRLRLGEKARELAGPSAGASSAGEAGELRRFNRERARKAEAAVALMLGLDPEPAP